MNLYLVLLLTFFWIQYNLSGLAGYLVSSKGRMHVFELYVHCLSSWSSQIFYMLGILAVSCGSLFYSNGGAYYLLRGNRRRWALGQVLYLLIMTAGYNLFLLFSFCFSTGWHLTLANKWSRASVLAEQFGMRIIGCQNVSGISYSVMQMPPVSAGLLTFLLSMLVGMTAGMVMICFGIRGKGAFGAAVILTVWWSNLLIEDISYFSKARYLSPAGLSSISRLLSLNGSAAIAYAVMFFCILIAIELFVLLGSVEKIDLMKLE